jgi:cation/acetate symporter
MNRFSMSLGVTLGIIIGDLPLTARASNGQIAGHGSIALSMFAVIVFITIAVSFWAARHVRSAHDFYTAGSRISGLQNGLAISGDFMSASTFLGVVGLVFAGNGEAVIYIASPILGLALLLLYVAEPLRNLGQYTVTQVISLRFEGRAIRVFGALSTLTVTLFYLIAQMVGAAALLQILVGIPNSAAVVLVAGLMMLYVLLGGMLATTWVQIIKAVLLVGCVLLLSAIALGHVGFDLSRLYELASHQILATQGASGGSSALASPFSALSLGVAMSFGMAGLPHLLIRFFTVPNAVEARRSVLTAAFIIAGVFLLMVFVLAYAAIAFVQNRPELLDAKGHLQGGANMAVIHLAGVLGGEVLLGVVAAVTFATILAVVAGLTMAGAGALANDLYVQVLRGGSVGDTAQVRSFRIATVLVTAAAIAFGIVFEGQSIAYMVSLAFTVAASANFPVLILAIYWKGLTRRGVLMGGWVGLIGSVLLIVAGPAIWVGVLGHPQPLFPYAYPALASMPLAFLTAWMVSRFDPRYADPAAQRTFAELSRRAQEHRPASIPTPVH